jgi:phage terminase large subunit
MEIEVSPEVNPNRPEQIYYVNGSEFAFFGLDYAEKLHGRKQDWAWINETMEVGKKQFDQLEMRTTKGIILDYNPYDDLHWVFELQKRPDVTVIKSTMLDNPFLPKAIINKIKSYEPTPENIKNGTADNYMWEVYGKGEKARLQGTIFNNWDLIEDIPEEAKFMGIGLDFGYSNDPTAVVELFMMDDELYFNQLLYEKGLTNQEIAEKLKELEVDYSKEIYADSSEPKSIEEIRRAGFDIKPVEKGSDSINYGIDIMKSRKMHITRKSTELEVELRRYKWSEDRAGRILNKPVDAYNHGIDACRYISMMKLGKEVEIQIIPAWQLGV